PARGAPKGRNRVPSNARPPTTKPSDSPMALLPVKVGQRRSNTPRARTPPRGGMGLALRSAEAAGLLLGDGGLAAGVAVDDGRRIRGLGLEAIDGDRSGHAGVARAGGAMADDQRVPGIIVGHGGAAGGLQGSVGGEDQVQAE